jgi:Zn-dependent membrane protease YugP
MFFDPLYWLLIGIGMALSLWAQFRVKSTFAKYSEVGSRSRMTGADVARRILDDNRIAGVRIEPVQGQLSDHYDPTSRTLRLSEPVYGSSSLAALGVAAHEVGHAIQHAAGYAPLGWRSAWVPVANLGSGLSMFVIMAAVMLGGAQTALGSNLGLLGVLLFATTTVFTLVTLPVEFDASRRALVSLERGGYMTVDELGGARKVLNAAALTYVAAFVTSLLTLLYWMVRLGLLGGNRDRD